MRKCIFQRTAGRTRLQDVFIAIQTSVNAQNIVKAVDAAARLDVRNFVFAVKQEGILCARGHVSMFLH